MQIVMLNGGLGNQVFQYIFFRWLEIRTGETCVIDDSAFWGGQIEHNGYELERVFSVFPKRLSEYFAPEVWSMMIERMEKGTPVYQQLADAGMELVMVCQPLSGEVPFVGSRRTFDAGMVPFSDQANYYYYGYWIGLYWMKKISGIIDSELRFPPLPAGYNRQVGQQIRASRNPVAIHIRRGDMARLGWTAGWEYYQQRIIYLEQQMKVDQYYLFSDDLCWCQEHSQTLGLAAIGDRLTIVEGNQGDKAYVDMQLMALCHHRLSDHSSFSLLAGILCRYPDKMEINRWG